MTIFDDLLFQQEKNKVGDFIEVHANWCEKHIYAKPYKAQLQNKNAGGNSEEQFVFPKPVHGIQHASRATLYIPLWVNLWHKYTDAAQKLTDLEIKYLQIAALFHDSGREDDGEDKWDKDSAVNCYKYFKLNLNADHETAKKYAEFVANKDARDEFYEIEMQCDGDNVAISWNKETRDIKDIDIQQKILHDADCLDIIRARLQFESEYLYFYREVAEKSEDAFEDLAFVITQARSLIATQGDTYRTYGFLPQDFKIKRNYLVNCFTKTVNDMKQLKINWLIVNEGKLEKNFLQKNKLVSFEEYNPADPISEDTMNIAMWNGLVFARALLPVNIRNPNSELLSVRIKKKNNVKKDQTSAGIEIRKTQKDGGNQGRSISQLYASGTYTNVGFLLIPEISEITDVKHHDGGTGRGKKQYFSVEANDSIHDKLQDLFRQLKKGGTKPVYFNLLGNANAPSCHNEVTCNVTKDNIKAIFYNTDSCLFGHEFNATGIISNESSLKLQAIYLQMKYKDATGKTLPIFEYSPQHNKFTEFKYNEKDIYQLWVGLAEDFLIGAQNDKKKFEKIFNLELKDFKQCLLYEFFIQFEHQDLCYHYTEELRSGINAQIEQRLIEAKSKYKKDLCAEVANIKNMGDLLKKLTTQKVKILLATDYDEDSEQRLRKAFERISRRSSIVINIDSFDAVQAEDKKKLASAILNGEKEKANILLKEIKEINFGNTVSCYLLAKKFKAQKMKENIAVCFEKKFKKPGKNNEYFDLFGFLVDAYYLDFFNDNKAEIEQCFINRIMDVSSILEFAEEGIINEKIACHMQTIIDHELTKNFLNIENLCDLTEAIKIIKLHACLEQAKEQEYVKLILSAIEKDISFAEHEDITRDVNSINNILSFLSSSNLRLDSSQLNNVAIKIVNKLFEISLEKSFRDKFYFFNDFVGFLQSMLNLTKYLTSLKVKEDIKEKYFCLLVRFLRDHYDNLQKRMIITEIKMLVDHICRSDFPVIYQDVIRTIVDDFLCHHCELWEKAARLDEVKSLVKMAREHKLDAFMKRLSVFIKNRVESVRKRQPHMVGSWERLQKLSDLDESLASNINGDGGFFLAVSNVVSASLLDEKILQAIINNCMNIDAHVAQTVSILHEEKLLDVDIAKAVVDKASNDNSILRDNITMAKKMGVLNGEVWCLIISKDRELNNEEWINLFATGRQTNIARSPAREKTNCFAHFFGALKKCSITNCCGMESTCKIM